MLKNACINGKRVAANAENARKIVEQYLSEIPPPQFSFDCIQTYMAFRNDCWDFINFCYDPKDTPQYNPEKGKFVLHYSGSQWEIVSELDFQYFYGE